MEAVSLIGMAEDIIDRSLMEENGAFDNLPYNLQDGETGVKIEDAIDALNEALDFLSDAKTSVKAATA